MVIVSLDKNDSVSIKRNHKNTFRKWKKMLQDQYKFFFANH